MLLEKLLEEFDVDPNTFSSEESKLFGFTGNQSGCK